jgi:plasmid maintenance system antidote protein VapI
MWKADDLLVLNDDDVADLVRAAVKREGSKADFAKRYGIARTDLSAFLNGRRGISASLAKALGLRRVWVVE